MSQTRGRLSNTRHQFRDRPHERTMERVAFEAWIEDFNHGELVTAATKVWLHQRFLDELDRRRGLERAWRKVFWSTRYVVLAGSLTLPVLITAGKAIVWLNTAAIIVSIFVALATAMEALLRTGRKWRLYRQGADSLSSEGAAFFQSLDAYADLGPAEGLRMFKERIEANIRDLHESYVADIEIMASQNAVASSADRPDQV